MFRSKWKSKVGINSFLTARSHSSVVVNFLCLTVALTAKLNKCFEFYYSVKIIRATVNCFFQLVPCKSLLIDRFGVCGSFLGCWILTTRCMVWCCEVSTVSFQGSSEDICDAHDSCCWECKHDVGPAVAWQCWCLWTVLCNVLAPNCCIMSNL